MIRIAQTSDAQELRDICDISLGYSVSTELVQEQITRLTKDPNQYLVVFEEETTQTVVGFLHASRYESIYSEAGFNIMGLAVHPDYQHQGIGKKLLLSLEDEAKKKHYPYIRFNSAEHRRAAHVFYERCGYVSDKTQKRFLKQFED
ncbi:GNAT family N-acetyltransferase [Streptococcus zalophi]|uniref:GNAT family N-acetyltransferase n=1 Tax=Streptococcus zalophi TaxID=640031 RepID=A0A934PAT1_9STRE|nr:GNAT family N-acetyltransferase [Streptococcus zalophi]MBJ8349986.1 GNAT family N-acetyltransferase [Streptococcus zalophi]